MKVVLILVNDFLSIMRVVMGGGGDILAAILLLEGRREGGV